MNQSRKCPRCGSVQSRRSRRNLLEHLLLILRPYRCANCRHRYCTLGFPRRDEALPPRQWPTPLFRAGLSPPHYTLVPDPGKNTGLHLSYGFRMAVTTQQKASVRAVVLLRPSEKQRLEWLARKERVSSAEILRRSLSAYGQQEALGRNELWFDRTRESIPSTRK